MNEKKFKKYVYIVDTKLVAYYLYQRGSPIYGILDKIAQMLFEHPKGEVYFAFDIGKSSFRSKIHPMYKGHRAKRNSQLDSEELARLDMFNNDYIRLAELCKLLPVRVLAVHGVEADDLVSLITCEHQPNQDTMIYLLTADMDYVNSVVGTDNVAILDVFNNVTVDNAFVKNKYDLHNRRQFNVHKAIFGDKSDNIKFIKGVGEIKASEIFSMVYELYEDPTNDEIARVIEQYLRKFPKLKLHPYHLDMGRTTVIDALNANLEIVDTFTDTTKMTDAQKLAYQECLTYTMPTGIDSIEFIKKSMDIVGYPITVGRKASRVFKIKDN